MPELGHRLKKACPDCGFDMMLRQSRYGLFYGCVMYPDCRASHGAHPDGEPLGVPADSETKQWRIKAHEAFDRLWSDEAIREEYGIPPNRRVSRSLRTLTRSRCYAWLAQRMGVDEWHFGSADAEACAAAIRVLEGVTTKEVRRACKEAS